ncbi:uncharacterized protein LOC136081742 [Hydra vulgaris]|uniref:Uncharacterized protein LOC136081742 n=1 Tax=Hydra vulgaris TaxID=6087 RepID=A0ABM4C2E9_HYDVU
MSPVVNEQAITESTSQPLSVAIERGSVLSTPHVASQQSATPTTVVCQQSATPATVASIFTLLVKLKGQVTNLQKQTNYNTTMLQTLSQGGIQEDGNIFEALDLPVCDLKQLQQLEDSARCSLYTGRSQVQVTLLQVT